MPYTNIADAKIKKLDNTPLSLQQINSIARMADAIGGDIGWATAIAHFKKIHTIKDGVWIKNEKPDEESTLAVSKEDDGRYKIISVSTSAIADLEDEIFTTKAIDYDAKMAESTDEYPEYRLFHKKHLGIGKVEKMYRIGIFAIEEGKSYSDTFSKQICEKMLNDNPGKWRTSRGFYVIEVAGTCPNCESGLVIGQKHMKIGFKCPTCNSYHSTYKRVLKDIRYIKTKTFDITITDIPCNPLTGVAAIKDDKILMEYNEMTKKQLKEKLLTAGLTEEVVEAKLSSLTEEQLKEYDGIPEATLLKEFQEDDQAESGEDVEGEVLVFDEATIKQISDTVIAGIAEKIDVAIETKLKEVLSTIELEISGDADANAFKELSEFKQLVEDIADVKKSVAELVKSDAIKVAETITDMPKNGKLRVMMTKSKPMPNIEAMGDEEDEEDEDTIMSSEGKEFSSMTDFIRSNS